MIIATHNGAFHADDVFGVLVLSMLHPSAQIVRTRDRALIASADFAVDVGGIWDSRSGRFDHHQRGFDGQRSSGVVYASAGLVWECYGTSVVAALAQSLGRPMSPEQCGGIAAAIDADLVQYLDMDDTGAESNAPGLFGLSAIIAQFNPSWMDEQLHGDGARMQRFEAAMALMRAVLSHAVANQVSEVVAADRVRAAERIEGGRVLLLESGKLPWAKLVHEEMPDLLFVIYPDSSDQQYQVRTVLVTPESFASRRDLPAAWAGLRDADLALTTGVPDAVFCHNNLFIAGAGSLAGAKQLAALALLGL